MQYRANPTKSENYAMEGTSKVTIPPAGEQSTLADKEALKGKDEKQTIISSTGDQVLVGKSGDFIAVRNGIPFSKNC